MVHNMQYVTEKKHNVHIPATCFGLPRPWKRSECKIYSRGYL